MTVQERFGTKIQLNNMEFIDSYTNAHYRMTDSGIITLGGNLTRISYEDFLNMKILAEYDCWAGITVFVAPQHMERMDTYGKAL